MLQLTNLGSECPSWNPWSLLQKGQFEGWSTLTTTVMFTAELVIRLKPCEDKPQRVHLPFRDCVPSGTAPENKASSHRSRKDDRQQHNASGMYPTGRTHTKLRSHNQKSLETAGTANTFAKAPKVTVVLIKRKPAWSSKFQKELSEAPCKVLFSVGVVAGLRSPPAHPLPNSPEERAAASAIPPPHLSLSSQLPGQLWASSFTRCFLFCLPEPACIFFFYMDA